MEDRAHVEGGTDEGQHRPGHREHPVGGGGSGAGQVEEHPTTTDNNTDWSTQLVERRWGINASLRIRWMHTALGIA